jgi:hypothetical protein
MIPSKKLRRRRLIEEHLKLGGVIMVRKRLSLGILIIGIFLLCFSMASAETIFSEDWESGQGNWDIDNGVWEVGSPDPTVGPGAPYGGEKCAGTVLDGDYAAYTDSRLISPRFRLPEVTGDEELRLRFRHWSSYSSYDYGCVRIKFLNEETGEWSPWQPVRPAPFDVDVGPYSHSHVWWLKDIDLTAYAGKKVQIAFYHTADRDSWGHPSESTGWYIDDVEVIIKVPEFTFGDFESGWRDWGIDNGVWQVGSPTAGPGESHGGMTCVGTVLDGNYPGYTDSRLISPSIRLPAVMGDEELRLRFWHWFSYSSYDKGYVQISVQDEEKGEWSAWDDIFGPVSGVSAVWTRKTLYLTAYAGQKVRINFRHTADRDSWGHPSESTGWYIDDVRLPSVFCRPCEGDFDNDGDVDGSDLSVFAADFGRTDCLDLCFCDGDFDGDGDVDGSDLAILAADFGNTNCFN